LLVEAREEPIEDLLAANLTLAGGVVTFAVKALVRARPELIEHRFKWRRPNMRR
jgi:hypothetical protein